MDCTSPLPDKNQCAVCKKEQGVTACTGCYIKHYCGSEHQKADWPNHKKLCKVVKISTEQVYQAMDHMKHCMEEAGGDPRAYFQSNPDHYNGRISSSPVYPSPESHQVQHPCWRQRGSAELL